MPESQHIEYKQSWQDDHLRWICGFANAEGGVLQIGRDDKGKVVGVKNARKLMEDLPNKVRDILGLIVEVNRKEEDGTHYLEIIIEPCSNPIVANAFFRAGLIESWGRGIEKIRTACKQHQIKDLIFDTRLAGMMVTFIANPEHIPDAAAQVSPSERGQGVSSHQSGVESGVESEMASQILAHLRMAPLSKAEIARRLGKAKPTRYLNELMARLLQAGLVAYTIPDKPNSRLQKYCLTPKGLNQLKNA